MSTIVLAIAATSFVTLATLFVAPASAHAQACAPGVFNQSDMAGSYLGTDAPFFVEISPCGRADIVWYTPYGELRRASYTAMTRMAGGGYVYQVHQPGLGPWDTYGMVAKPAEPGTVQLLFSLTHSGELIVKHARKQ